MYIEAAVSIATLVIAIMMIRKPFPERPVPFDYCNIQQSSILFPNAIGYLEYDSPKDHVKKRHGTLVAMCDGSPGMIFARDRPQLYMPLFGSQLDSQDDGLNEGISTIMTQLNILGRGPVPYLTDLACIDKSNYFRHSTFEFEERLIRLHCMRIDPEFRTERPIKFHPNLIRKLKERCIGTDEVPGGNAALAEALAAAFCEALAIKTDQEISIEMYLRIALVDPVDFIEAGLFKLTPTEEEAKIRRMEMSKEKADESKSES